MRLLITPQGESDLHYWRAHDGDTLRRLDHLLACTRDEPLTGPGRPLPLRHHLAGCWSRRITGEHRLLYLIDGDDVVVLQARYHYESGA